MSGQPIHETHLIHRTNWLRAAVLGANDGILSIASILTGVAAGGATRSNIVLAGVAGLIAGATSMATGEYVSVSSQADIEAADLAKEGHELTHNAYFEEKELAHIYVKRGLDLKLATEVAKQLTAKDALAAHAHDELGISEFSIARPLQAAVSSAVSFTLGAVLPLIAALLAPHHVVVPVVFVCSLVTLIILGAVSARTGGVSMGKPIVRITLWGVFSMALTTVIGRLVGGSIS